LRCTCSWWRAAKVERPPHTKYHKNAKHGARRPVHQATAGAQREDGLDSQVFQDHKQHEAGDAPEDWPTIKMHGKKIPETADYSKRQKKATGTDDLFISAAT
jgi:hypothetical protein